MKKKEISPMKSNIVKRLFSVIIICCLCLAVFLPSADSEIDPDEAAGQYAIHCEFCHHPSGTDDFPNKNSFTSAADLIDAYNREEDEHQTVNFSCDSNCVENTITYVWEVLWGNTSNDPDDAVNETTMQLYATKCASCHGESATDVFPNLVTFTSANELINTYSEVVPHNGVEDCDTTCINTTNTYIWETLWGNNLSAAELYTLKCAECHGASARYAFPNRGAFTSESQLIAAYADVPAHDHVETCSATCIESTNTYIWYVLWDKVTHENTGCFIHSMNR